MNTVNLIGRLTKDPELRYTPSGIAVCKFTLAVNRDFTNQNGERETDFINCTVFKKTAESLANYQRKGSQIGVIGRIQTRSYQRDDGTKVFTTDVIVDRVEFLGSKQNNEQQNNYGQQNNQQYNNQQINVSPDDLPFF